MKYIQYILLIVAIVILVIQTVSVIQENYSFEKNYKNHWSLADKSSTIEAKQKHIKDFVNALEDGNARGQFSEYNALYLQTDNNSFRANMAALHTLSDRLDQIQDMNPNSFEYNTAIQQITAQEQGQAQAMLNVLSGCYGLANYLLVWNWIGGSIFVINIFIIIIDLAYISIPSY